MHIVRVSKKAIYCEYNYVVRKFDSIFISKEKITSNVHELHKQKTVDLWFESDRKIDWWNLQSKCFFFGPIISSVVALHTDLANPCPAKLWRAASNRSFIVWPAIFYDFLFLFDIFFSFSYNKIFSFNLSSWIIFRFLNIGRYRLYFFLLIYSWFFLHIKFLYFIYIIFHALYIFVWYITFILHTLTHTERKFLLAKIFFTISSLFLLIFRIGICIAFSMNFINSLSITDTGVPDPNFYKFFSN